MSVLRPTMAPGQSLLRDLASHNAHPVTGGDQTDVAINERTGRPIRRSVGRVNYNMSDELDHDSDDDGSGDYKMEDVNTAASQSTDTDLPNPLPLPKRATESPLRPLDRLPPLVPNYGRPQNPLDTTSDLAASGRVDHAFDPNDGTLHLTFNIPLGFSGPLNVDIPRGVLRSIDQPRSSFASAHPACNAGDGTALLSNWGWPTLPPELRNKIYRMLFVEDESFDFLHPHNFARSAQFLRTCKQVHSEGRELLYSENKFYFHRKKELRSFYWDPMPKEIGYMDLRQFLTTIGSLNVSMLRFVTLLCEDMQPKHDIGHPALGAKERRYTRDANLIECIRILGKFGSLYELRLGLYSKHWLAMADDRFLAALKTIKVDKLCFIDHPTERLQVMGFRGGIVQKCQVDVYMRVAIEKALKRKKEAYEWV